MVSLTPGALSSVLATSAVPSIFLAQQPRCFSTRRYHWRRPSAVRPESRARPRPPPLPRPRPGSQSAVRRSGPGHVDDADAGSLPLGRGARNPAGLCGGAGAGARRLGQGARGRSRAISSPRVGPRKRTDETPSRQARRLCLLLSRSSAGVLQSRVVRGSDRAARAPGPRYWPPLDRDNRRVLPHLDCAAIRAGLKWSAGPGLGRCRRSRTARRHPRHAFAPRR